MQLSIRAIAPLFRGKRERERYKVCVYIYRTVYLHVDIKGRIPADPSHSLFGSPTKQVEQTPTKHAIMPYYLASLQPNLTPA